MEIGSFFELMIPSNLEYYKGYSNVARLNSGRAAIYHAVKVMGCDTVWMPHYQCKTVREFLIQKGVKVKYYHINNCFDPIDISQLHGEAVALVNYYGIMSTSRMEQLASYYRNVIIDNAQAFFSTPIKGCMNVYSARKFIGVPDGAYVIGKDAQNYTKLYEQGYSSDTSLFLLQRIEYGCEGRAYQSRIKNEERLDNEDVLNMSGLTKAILDGTDYNTIIKKRQENNKEAVESFSCLNMIDINKYIDISCVPMVYPLMVEDDGLMECLLEAKHFQGRWWQHIIKEMKPTDFEYQLSRYMIPITIDQRYSKNELEYIKAIIFGRKSLVGQD